MEEENSPRNNADDMESRKTETPISAEADSHDDLDLEAEAANEPSSKRRKLEESADGCESSTTQSQEPNEAKILEDAKTISEMKARIKAKERVLCQLKQVESYKNKRSIEDLKNETSVWKEIGLTAFEDLFKKSSEEKESLTKEELLKYLGVDPDVLGIDVNE